MEQKSLWFKDLKKYSYEELNENIAVDILIIGGGITGLSTLYYLKDTDFKIALVDSNFIGQGVSGKTTGKITFLQETVYTDLLDRYSFKIAKMYYSSQREAIKEIKHIINKENIKCDLKKVTSYVFTNDSLEADNLKREKIILEKIGVLVKDSKNLDNNLDCLYAIAVNNSYVFHPIKYLQALRKICLKANKSIFEKTTVRNIKKENDYYICQTNNYVIKAKKVVVACHYPFFIKPYFMPMKCYIEKSYIIAGLAKMNENKTYNTSSNPYQSLRYHFDRRNYFLYLGESSNICNELNDIKNGKKLIRKGHNYNLEAKYIWKNDDLMTVDKMPYIGKINVDDNNLLLATGYNAWGMTNGTMAGKILSDILQDKKNKFISLFNPLRVKWLNSGDKYFKNVMSNMKGYIQNKIFVDKKWYKNKIKFDVVNGKNIAIYDDGQKHIVYNKCPHLGCSLIFNELEKT